MLSEKNDSLKQKITKHELLQSRCLENKVVRYTCTLRNSKSERKKIIFDEMNNTKQYSHCRILYSKIRFLVKKKKKNWRYTHIYASSFFRRLQHIYLCLGSFFFFFFYHKTLVFKNVLYKTYGVSIDFGIHFTRKTYYILSNQLFQKKVLYKSAQYYVIL